MAQPDCKQFVALAAGCNVIPVSVEVVADALTPVLAAATLGRESGSFLLESVVGGEKWGRYSFLGFEPVALIRAGADGFEVEGGGTLRRRTVDDPWEELRGLLRMFRPARVAGLPRFWGGLVGYVAYDAVRRFEPTVAPHLKPGGEYEFSFSLGGTIVVFDALRQTARIVVPAFVGEAARMLGIAAASPTQAYAMAVDRLDAAVDALRAPGRVRMLEPPAAVSAMSLPPSSFTREGFVSAVSAVKQHIRAGDIFQGVLSQRFRVPADGLQLLDVYRAMRVINPSPYMYFLRLPEVGIAGASPETLVRLEDGVAEVRPIAGTRPRGVTTEEDQTIERELLADPKERAEHVMLVDLGRNDLGRVCKPGTVKVVDRMTVERYSHVMHIVSSVRGEVAEGRDAIDVLRAAFPAGTLTGAPKVRAMQILGDLEPEARGVYGGAVGYIGFDGNMDLAIAIRTVVQSGDELWLQAGAGIVEASDPDAEWTETVNKARAALQAVGDAT